MADSPTETVKDLVQRVELDQVFFGRYGAERLTLGQAPRQFKVDYEFGGSGAITSPTTFEASTVFRVTAKGEDGSPIVKASAEITLKYRVAAGIALEEGVVSTFAETNAVFNAWPYFREFVHSAIPRLGLNITITIPLLRFADLKAMRLNKGEDGGKAKKRA